MCDVMRLNISPIPPAVESGSFGPNCTAVNAAPER